jgi:hypothetical protein
MVKTDVEEESSHLLCLMPSSLVQTAQIQLGLRTLDWTVYAGEK